MDEEAVLVCSPRIVPLRITCGEWLAEQNSSMMIPCTTVANFSFMGRSLSRNIAPATRYTGLHINSTSAVIMAAAARVAIVRRALVEQLIATGR